MLEANRANARKSTGPRTKAGKERSRWNALVHGLSATVGLLPGEDPRKFKQFGAGIVAAMRPRGQAEAVLVDQYVSIAWKLRRLGGAERAVSTESFSRDVAQWMKDHQDRAWALRNPKLFEPDALEEIREPAPEMPEPMTGAELLSAELHEGKGPMLRLIELEMRLRATLSNTVRQFRDLQALHATREALERKEEGEGKEPWAEGEWEEDERFTRVRGPGERDADWVDGRWVGDDAEDDDGSDEDGEEAGAEEAGAEEVEPTAKGQAAAAPAAGPAESGASEGSKLRNEPDAAPAPACGAQVLPEGRDAERGGGAAGVENVALCAPGQPDRPAGETSPPVTPVVTEGSDGPPA